MTRIKQVSNTSVPKLEEIFTLNQRYGALSLSNLRVEVRLALVYETCLASHSELALAEDSVDPRQLHATPRGINPEQQSVTKVY